MEPPDSGTQSGFIWPTGWIELTAKALIGSVWTVGLSVAVAPLLNADIRT